MEVLNKSSDRAYATTMHASPAIPARPNIVEMVALLEDPRLQARDRNQLKRVLHDTVHLVRKQGGGVRLVGLK